MIAVSRGGGGYGAPLERPPDRVKHDVDERYLSWEGAERVYGVVLDADGAVDEDATAARRTWCKTAE